MASKLDGGIVVSKEALSVRLIKEKEQILGAWMRRVREEVASARDKDSFYLRDHLPELLNHLGSALKEPGRIKELTQVIKLGAEHGRQRAQSQDYRLQDVIKEYGLLQETIFNLGTGDTPLSSEAAVIVSRFIEISINKAADDFLYCTQRRVKNETEAEFQSLFNSLPGAYLVLNRDLKILTANRRYLESTMKTLGDIAGRHVFEAFPDDANDPTATGVHALNESFQRVIQDRRPDVMALQKYSVQRPDGTFERRYWSPMNFPVLDAQGEILYIVHSAEDVTRFAEDHEDKDAPAGLKNEIVRMQAEVILRAQEVQAANTELRRSREQLAQAIKTARVGFWEVALESRRTTLSPQMAEDWGVDLKTFPETLEAALERIHPLDREKTIEAIERAIAAHSIFTTEYRVVRPDGSIRWIEARGQILLDEKGQPTRFSGTSLDVTERILARQRIEDSVQEFRALADSMPQIVWGADALGHVDYFNRRWTEYTGLSPELSLNGGWMQAIHPDDLKQLLPLWDSVLKSGGTYEVECRLRAISGEYRWHLFRAQPTYDENGKIRRWYGTDTDIHERKIEREKLQELTSQLKHSQVRFETATRATRNAIWDWDLLSNSIEWNEAISSELGYPATLRKTTGSWWIDHIHHDDRERVSREIHQLMELGRNHWSDEYWFERGDGTFALVRDRGFVLHDEFGKPIRMIGAMENVTTERQVMADLKRSQHHFRLVTDAVPAMIGYIAPDYRYTFANAQYEKVFGKRPEEVVGMRVQDLVDEGGFQQRKSAIDAALRGEPQQILVDTHDSQGNKRYLSNSFIPDRDENGVVRGTVILAQDRTQEVRHAEELLQAKEAAEAANSAKSAFLANMSHEIRTPLGAIMGFVDLMKDPTLSPNELKDYLAVIDRNSGQLLRIIDDILDLAKVEAGKVVIEKIEFSLPELLADFSSLMGFRAKENAIQFSVAATSSIPECIVSDPVRIRQILTNVVGNAIKFTSRGVVEMNVSFQGDSLSFSVRDTGRGISAEQAANLFQPFMQADVSTTRKFGGTGLGLVLTKRLSQAMGGDFRLVESELGKGSTFVSRIRVGVTPGTKFVGTEAIRFSNESRPTNERDRGVLTGLRVLLVEDSPDNQALLKILLTRAGASIEIANDGYQGVEKALDTEFDVVLMDVQMPRMDGHEATRRLRAAGLKTPIVALTAHAMKEERERTVRSGFSDFLPKPVQKDQLIELLVSYRRNDCNDQQPVLQ